MIILRKSKKSVVVLLVLFSFLQGHAQREVRTIMEDRSPVFTINSNLLYDVTTSMNIGMEFKVAKRLTLKLPVTYNPWTFADNKKFKFLLVQPELRWWLCEPFAGHFFGLHGHYALFNVGGIGPENITGNIFNHRYEGDLYGAGISYGYQFYLAPRWNLELNIGAGWAHITYDRYPCEKCASVELSGTKDYFGPTQAGITLIYIIK
ncbi:MAG: DUF3575 domain-containing protein [Dysgonamonadaceae bacterium]|nr:DUF3575 domain-containing protein [Dysgonamonadaceae bacterium]